MTDAWKDAWKAYSFNVPGLTVLGGNDLYEYKLPYTIQQIGCCARISPYCYCCDLTLFKSCNKGGTPTFMDMVDQRTGDQVRYRSVKSRCMPPKVLMFHSGKYMGHVSRTLRCCNRCRTCMEDCRSAPVNLIGLHDSAGTQQARVERNGRGCCLEINCNFPFACIGCCFYCITCTVAFRPTADPCLGGRADWACMPHGCLTCDPVCCAGCLRGPNTLCLMDDLPCLAVGFPPCCKAPSVWCPVPKCISKPLQNSSTIMLETHGLVDSQERKNIGIIQFQYRGNFPSAYTHDQTKPLNAAVAAGTADVGLLASGVVVGKVYGMGEAEAPFYDLPPRPEGRSPDFEGWVTCAKSSQMKELQDKLREDMVVQEDMMLGDPISGNQVRGWMLTDIGYMKSGTECCGSQQGGEKQEPRPVSTKEEVQEVAHLALKDEIGEYGTNFLMRFRLPDNEKQVVTEGVDPKFNAFGQGFAKNMLEEVSCACVCMRVWQCPCELTHKYVPLCRMPLYARKFTGSDSLKGKSELPPIQVVMNTRMLR